MLAETRKSTVEHYNASQYSSHFGKRLTKYDAEMTRALSIVLQIYSLIGQGALALPYHVGTRRTSWRSSRRICRKTLHSEL